MNERLPNLTEEQLEDVEKELLPTQGLRETLELNDRGNPKANVPNVERILMEDPFFAGAICFNELSERIDIVKDLGWKRDSVTLTDTDMAYITLYIEKNYGIGYQSVIETAIKVVANENRYHPIRDVLNSLVWDGVPRVENMLTHFFGADRSELITTTMKLFMLGAVARIFTPGIKFETSMCLVGGQGVGKSTFFKFLAIRDEWFTDDLKNLSDDRMAARLQGHFIVEMVEMLAVINAKAEEELKCFISREKDTYRTPYDKHPRDRKRQCVFGGTSNKIEILPMDKSGNRRIVPIETHPENAEVHILDNEAESRAYILQAWAEIMVIYRSGDYILTLPDHLKKELDKYQQRFTPEDTEQVSIENFLDKTKENLVCIRMLFHEALGHSSYEEPKKSESNRIAEILHHVPGWVAVGTRTVEPYGRVRAWKRKNDVMQDTGDEFLSIPEQMEIPFGN
ncbi:MAG: virulence-associated E family protein [Lachnospiraceae bacterium]|nr:virulence-associated E family protein [Lachnospiraceae bacterium]